jgi:hypothetical protein
VEAPTPVKKKEKVIVISDTDSDDGEPKDEEYSNVVSNLQDDNSQLISQTVAQNLDRFFENIPPLCSTERFSFVKKPQNQPYNDDHAEKMDKSNEKEKMNEILEEKDEVSATDEESFNQPNVHKDQEHVEISESSAEEDEQKTPVQPSPVSVATTEPKTDLIPSNNVLSEEILHTPVSCHSNVINISAKIKINIQVSYRGGSTTSASTVASTSSDSDGDDGGRSKVPNKKKGNKVQSSTHHSYNKKIHISMDDANEQPGTSGKKRQPPKSRRRSSNVSLAKTPVSSTKRRNTPQLAGSNHSKVHKELANVRQQEEQKRNLTNIVPQSNQNLFEESDAEEIIDEDMEAMLDEVYGNEWRTPAMLKTCASVKKSMPKHNVTTNPDFSLCKY